LSVEVFGEGKIVRIKLPKEIAEDSSVIVEECEKKERDEECNWCTGKYACKLFCDSMPILKAVVINN